ncbi:hypothetical protein E4099_16585 [Streptomyces palmae]|uniref:Uncharacterized protein n=1 Tax=Streptomyces palmae TaxID=1701085 RepID=A0A4Z0H662_9ACTN|nr:hypothetical protein E4099_16585 [Streptomyces palmae]
MPGFDVVDGRPSSAGNAWNLADGTGRASGWPPLSADGAGRPTCHRPFGSASWCPSCQSTSPPTQTQKPLPTGQRSARNYLHNLALDLYTHGVPAFRLTLQSDTSVDVAMLLRDVVLPLPMREGAEATTILGHTYTDPCPAPGARRPVVGRNTQAGAIRCRGWRRPGRRLRRSRRTGPDRSPRPRGR